MPQCRLVEVDARSRWFHLAADRGRDAVPVVLIRGEIARDWTDLAVLLDEAVDHPRRSAQARGDGPESARRGATDVVAGAGLRLGARREDVLVALRGDVIDLHLDFVLLTPFIAKFGQRIVCAGYPMIPDAERQCAGCVGAVDIRCGESPRQNRARRFSGRRDAIDENIPWSPPNKRH